MRRIAAAVLVFLSTLMFACGGSTQAANTATDDSMATGPSSNSTTTSAPTPTDTTYTNATSGPSATTGTPVSATGT